MIWAFLKFRTARGVPVREIVHQAFASDALGLRRFGQNGEHCDLGNPDQRNLHLGDEGGGNPFSDLRES